jgi:hypothetical protein
MTSNTETETHKNRSSILDELTKEDVLDKKTLKALDPERPLAIKKIAPRLYEAISTHEDNTQRYRIDMDNNPVCECRGFMYHGECRHIRRLRIVTGEYKLPYLAKLIEIEFDENIGKFIETNITYKESNKRK